MAMSSYPSLDTDYFERQVNIALSRGKTDDAVGQIAGAILMLSENLDAAHERIAELEDKITAQG